MQKQRYQWVAANPVPSMRDDDEGLRMIFRQNRVAMPCSALFLPSLRVLRVSVVNFRRHCKLALSH